MADYSLDATVRGESGTGAAREVRRNGQVPGIVYGGQGEPVAIAIELRAMNRALSTTGLMSQTIALTVDGKTETVRLHDVQRHPVTENALHVDFLRVS